MVLAKLLTVFNLVKPVLGKKIPMFSQDVGQFATSKSNWIGVGMICLGAVMLYKNIDSEIGMILFANGLGLITLKDATVK
jgi:hypothetical protein